MDRETLLIHMNRFTEKAKKFLVRDKGLSPVAIGFSDDGGVSALLIPPFDNQDDRMAISAGIKIFAEKIKAKAVIVINEAWMAMAQPDQLDMEVAVSEMPNRKECIMINGVTESCKLTAIVEFERNESGDIIFKEALPYTEHFRVHLVDGIFDHSTQHSAFN